MDNIHSLRFFWPESVLTVAVLAMLVQDLIVRRSKRRVPSLVAGALFWLALTAAATWATPSTTTPLFGGLLQHDPLRLFFAWLFLAAAFLTVIIVPKSAQISPARLGEFIALLFALVLGMFLMASATDLLMIYLAVETVSLVSYVLTSFRRADRKANEAAAIRFFFAAFERPVPGGGYAPITDLPWPAIIGIISAITMTLGNLTAIVQTNLKRMLAYSSIAHAGYLLMGLAAASTAGVQSILVYLIVYVLMNVGAEAVIERTPHFAAVPDVRALVFRLRYDRPSGLRAFARSSPCGGRLGGRRSVGNVWVGAHSVLSLLAK